MKNWIALVATTLVFSPVSFAEESNQPYIDLLKQTMPPEKNVAPAAESGEPDPYIQSIRKKQEAQPGWVEDPSQNYTDRLRESDPKRGQNESSEGYSDGIRSRLEPKPPGGAIEAVMQNRSELQQKRLGDIHHAFGFRVSASRTFSITGETGSANGNFSDYYKTGYTPELSFFWEYQPFHSEWFGNFGLIGSGTVSYAMGKGRFPSAVAGSLANPFGGSDFTLDSRTNLRFITIPVSVGLIYRFNLPRIIRPYAMVAPTLTAYGEYRDDNKGSKTGYSTGILFSGGINLEVDRLFKELAWDLYADYGIKKFYLTIDYSKLTTASGLISFDRSVVSLGMTYEY